MPALILNRQTGAEDRQQAIEEEFFMQTAMLPIMRDYLVRFQQSAIKETGRRPLSWLRTPEDEPLVIPGCRRPGYVFWQPIAWKEEKAPLGKQTAKFHQSIVDYLSLCQFLEMRFYLPVPASGNPLSFLYRRVFETERNTESAPPEQKFQEALLYAKEHPNLPLSFRLAATCDEGEPLLLMLRAEDGQAYILPADGSREPVYLSTTLERLLPRVQFVYEV